MLLPQPHSGLANAKGIFTRKNQMERCPASAHPFCREAHAVTRPNIPLLSQKGPRPRPPRLGRIVNGQSSAETRIYLPDGVSGSGYRQSHGQQVTLQSGAEAHTGAITLPRTRENMFSFLHLRGPTRTATPFEAGKELVGGALSNLPLWNPRQNDAVGALISIANIWGIH